MLIIEMQKKMEEGYSYQQIAELYEMSVEEVKELLETKTVSDANQVSEHAYMYGQKRQGEFTIEDYYALPEDQRVELIDGVFYDMAAPNTLHQAIAGQIYTRFDNYVRSKKGKCMPLISPIDVQLDRDNKTMVQPDVIILCDRGKFVKGIIYGAPDLVVEVLSPSTARRDQSLKLGKYIRAGVKEYWMVDPKRHKIVVYRLDTECESEGTYTLSDYDVALYSFEDEVSVHIWKDECQINFKEIYEYIEFLYEK